MKAAVVIGGGRTFIAGADIKEFAKMTSGKAERGAGLLPLLLKIENCAKPVVVAIHGTAFGGGLEIAMSGHYRVASPNAQVGQPEVKLGIIPGAGGTQRLPRLAGVAKAVEMCAEGKPVKAPDALKYGIVDRLIEGDLLAGAVAFAREIAEKPAPKTRETKTRNSERRSKMRRFLPRPAKPTRKKQRGLMAPLAAIDAIEAATKLPFEQGCENEARTFRQMPLSDQSKALIHVFFGEREVAKIPDVPKDTPRHPGEQSGRGGRRHDGRRHRDGLCQRRHSGAAKGSRPGGARSRHGEHSKELRELGEARPLHPAICGRTP